MEALLHSALLSIVQTEHSPAETAIATGQPSTVSFYKLVLYVFKCARETGKLRIV